MSVNTFLVQSQRIPLYREYLLPTEFLSALKRRVPVTSSTVATRAWRCVCRMENKVLIVDSKHIIYFL